MMLLRTLLSHYRRHPVQAVFLFTGIVVANVLLAGTLLINAQARQSYDRGEQFLSSAPTGYIRHSDKSKGIDEREYIKLRRQGFDKLVPVLRQFVRLENGQALELMLTGDMIDAEEACRIGLVNRVVAQDELLAHCFGIIEKIAQKGPIAIKLCKEAVASGIEMDLARVVPSVAGPARPQDRIRLPDLKDGFADILGCEYERDTDVANISIYHDESGSRTVRAETCDPGPQRRYPVHLGQKGTHLADGSIDTVAGGPGGRGPPGAGGHPRHGRPCLCRHYPG